MRLRRPRTGSDEGLGQGSSTAGLQPLAPTREWREK
ncbi:hypothetical protein BVRB_8g186830 [Beta vulgaris subsp. vulgaris]|nr:hypothetical protein BVRB_8g186830 [Beta vulgaris subsp. vulgaris]